MFNRKTTGIAVAIAWPETLCKQTGSWYEGIMSAIGINNNHFYKVGHAALILINNNGQEAKYYDFGRYHSPFQHGRVRSQETDHDLKIMTKVVFINGEITNLSDILTEVNNNESCHGDGPIVASQSKINFDRAVRKVIQMQKSSPLPYGPFIYNGTNCSRFVNTVLFTGQPSIIKQVLLKFTFSPTPLWNVKCLEKKVTLPKLNEENQGSILTLKPIGE
jgi:hypothetical protein